MVPFPKCYGPPLSINKLTLNEPAMKANKNRVTEEKAKENSKKEKKEEAKAEHKDTYSNEQKEEKLEKSDETKVETEVVEERKQDNVCAKKEVLKY